jgi:hypothetical protein
MTEHFLLQYRIANRKLAAAGVHPAVGYVLGLAVFVLVAELLFFKTPLAKYALLLAAVSVFLQWSDKNRTDFLRMTFGDATARRIRTAENLLLGLPFFLILVYHGAWAEAGLGVLGSVLLAQVSFQAPQHGVLPTPFRHRPFEFTVGFRTTFFMFPIAYTLTGIAVSVGNLNLGIFALLLVFLVTLTYYTKAEDVFFVWSYSCTPPQFLLGKLRTATCQAGLLVAPIVVGLLVFFPADWGFILTFLLIGYGFLWTMVLAKYAAYPREMNVPEGILFTLAIYFPPLLLALMPFFYYKSVKRLNTLLT